MLSGVAGGGLVAIAGAAVLRWAIPDYLVDLIAWGLGILVAPVAAAVAASVLRATRGRTVAAAGFALLAAFAATNLLDYQFTALLFLPGFPGPYQGKPEWSGEEVDRVARTWLTGRHVIAMTLGVFGGAGVGVRSGVTRRGTARKCDDLVWAQEVRLRPRSE